jgi:hypothetical protein
MPVTEFYSRLLSVDPRFVSSGPEEKQHWVESFSQCVEAFPYLLVEFKPCLGSIFQDFAEGYSHWGYADLDLLPGRAGFLTPQLLAGYDVYTSSFGDVSRLYLRGQLAVFRNTEQLRVLWRECPYFEQLTDRVATALALKAGGGGRRGGWHFESAEGCISRAVFGRRSGLSVFVASSQLSDAFRAPLRDKEAFFLGNTLLRCYQKPVPDLLDLGVDGVSSRSNYFATPPSRLLPGDRGSGRRVSSPTLGAEHEPNCMYWIRKEYQVSCSAPSRVVGES